MLTQYVINKIITSLKDLKISDESISTTVIVQSVETPPDIKLGDRSTNLAFKLAKILKKSPFIIAEEITKNIKSNLTDDDILADVQPTKGYINFFFDYAKVFNLLNDKISAPEPYGTNNSGNNRKIIVEHTSMNPIKPLHIGNLRNAILGDIIARLYHWNGWQVEVQNLIDDLGRQVATLVWAFINKIHLDVPRTPSLKFDLWLGLIYSKSNQILADTKKEKEIDHLMTKIKKDLQLYNFMRNLCEDCVNSNLETLWKLGITYDLLVWESDIAKSGIWEETLKLLEQNDHFVWEEEGENKDCFVAKLGNLKEFQDKRSPDKVFIRSNGVPTYVAHDVALQMWKFGKVKSSLLFKPVNRQFTIENQSKELWSSTDLSIFSQSLADRKFGKADRICNVIGTEQNYLQKIVRLTMKLLDYEKEYNNSFHLSYKHVKTPHSRFSGRTGNWYTQRAWADAILEDTTKSALTLIREKRPDLSFDKQSEIAEKIAIGAIRYWLAKFKTETEIIFTIEEATSLEGDSGPFLVYTYVRAKKILDKKENNHNSFEISTNNITINERKLILKIIDFPDIIQEAADSFSAVKLTRYALEIASLFNKFYETCPVISAKDNNIKNFRFSLVSAFLITMKNILSILGIPTVDEM